MLLLKNSDGKKMRGWFAILLFTAVFAAADDLTEHATPSETSHAREEVARETPSLENILSPCFEGRCSDASCRNTHAQLEDTSELPDEPR
jgi:hypothetical protein